MKSGKQLLGNHRETAQLLGISEQALWKAVKERGCPVHHRAGKGKETTYVLSDVVAWRIADVSPGELDLNAERARVAKEQAEKLARENARDRAETLTVAAVVDAWGEQISNARSKLLSMPPKLAPQLTNIKDASVIAAAIRAELYAALTELSQYEAPAAEPDTGSSNEGGVEDLGAAAVADGQRVGRHKPKTELRK